MYYQGLEVHKNKDLSQADQNTDSSVCMIIKCMFSRSLTNILQTHS